MEDIIYSALSRHYIQHGNRGLYKKNMEILEFIINNDTSILDENPGKVKFGCCKSEMWIFNCIFLCYQHSMEVSTLASIYNFSFPCIPA